MDNMDNIDRDNDLLQRSMEDTAQESPEPESEPVLEAEQQFQPASVSREPVAEQPYSNAGVGRKESPFANSPYVMEHQSQYNTGRYYTEPPKKAKKVKKEKKQRKPMGKALKGVVAAVLALALVGGTCAVTVAVTNNSWFKKTAAINNVYEQKMAELERRVEAAEKAAAANQGNVIQGDAVSSTYGLTASQVYAMNVNSVVAISNRAITTNIYGQETEMAASGSGFIISEDGYVVTNYHVVEGADKLSFITYDGTEYAAKLVGYDQSNDVSLLKIEATGLDPVTIGSSDDLIVGDQVVAIGNPLGELTSTLTVGYISAKDRTINTDGTYNINMMQTDAAINSGNSGGPLFNMKGEVIGITTAKYSGSSNSGASIEGIGFAIPMDDVMGILQDLRDYGYVKGAYLGVSVVTMDPAVAEAYGLPTGSKVSLVEPKYCAAKAGVQVGDIIIAMAGQDVSGNSDLLSILRQFRPGDTTTITVFRGGREIELSITLDEKPAPAVEQTAPETEPDTTVPSGYGEMPQEGDAWDWFNYYFGFGGR